MGDRRAHVSCPPPPLRRMRGFNHGRQTGWISCRAVRCLPGQSLEGTSWASDHAFKSSDQMAKRWPTNNSQIHILYNVFDVQIARWSRIPAPRIRHGACEQVESQNCSEDWQRKSPRRGQLIKERCAPIVCQATSHATGSLQGTTALPTRLGRRNGPA